MPYKATGTVVKILRNFRVRVEDLTHPPADAHYPIYEPAIERGMVHYEVNEVDLWGDYGESGDWLIVKEISFLCGTDYIETMSHIWQNSEGHLVAILVWEGGDNFTRFEVGNGVASESMYEI